LLRIHIEKEHDALTLRLEGKLVHSWADELIQAYINLREDSTSGQSIRIDLDAVSFVDDRGRATLANLRRLGCELTGSGPFISAVIEEISSDPTR
jgi:ABC-type transporter Mla MlaB component